MKRKKDEILSFSKEQKESVPKALQKLMRGRTIREVSQDWGIAPSNINNYLYRGSIPRMDILKKISLAEEMSIQDIFNLCNTDEEIPSHQQDENDPGVDEETRNLDYEKEAFKDRLWILIGSRSIRAAAKDWGLAFSTLNNYLTRGTDPALKVVYQIAKVENVELEWLASGVGQKQKSAAHDGDPKLAAWVGAYEALTPTEIDRMLKLIQRNGAASLLLLTDSENLELLSLSSQSKKIALLTRKLPTERLKEISEIIENGSESLPEYLNRTTLGRKVIGE